MRVRTAALFACALTGLLYLSAASASALPAPSRADVAAAKTAGITQQARRLRGFYRGWGYRPHRYYRPYRYYGYGYPYYSPYYYGGYGYPYYRRRGYGFYLGY